MLLQVITTIWTKRSRGAPASVSRNAVPEALAFPSSQPIPKGGMLLHSANFDEERDFQIRERVDALPHLREALGMSFLESPNGIDVLYSDSSGCGHPARAGLRRTQIFSLGVGEVGRLRINWRYSSSMTQYKDWVYVKEVVNVANSSECAADAFVSAAPDKLADHMADLW